MWYNAYIYDSKSGSFLGIEDEEAWFPKSWTDKDIRRAGEHVAGLKGNRRVADGRKIYGFYKGVRVGVIRTNGKIATVFPDSNQNKRR